MQFAPLLVSKSSGGGGRRTGGDRVLRGPAFARVTSVAPQSGAQAGGATVAPHDALAVVLL